MLTGPLLKAQSYIDGITMLASMRLCANVPCQHAIQTALGGYQSINELINDGGRLKTQLDIAHQLINEIDGLSCHKAKGAMYLFVKVDGEKLNITDDEQMVLDILRQEKILLVQGSAFNLKIGIYFRLVFLPHSEDLIKAIGRLKHFFSHYSQ